MGFFSHLFKQPQYEIKDEKVDLTTMIEFASHACDANSELLEKMTHLNIKPEMVQHHLTSHEVTKAKLYQYYLMDLLGENNYAFKTNNECQINNFMESFFTLKSFRYLPDELNVVCLHPSANLEAWLHSINIQWQSYEYQIVGLKDDYDERVILPLSIKNYHTFKKTFQDLGLELMGFEKGADYNMDMIDACLDRLHQQTEIDKIGLTFKVQETRLFDSQMGGVPYIPFGVEVPCTKQNEKMNLLIQINFDDLPKCDLPLPSTGLLQLWTKDDQIKAVYYDSCDPLVKKEDVLSKYKPDGQDNLRILFTLGKESMSSSDFLFEDYFVSCANHLYPQSRINRLSDLDQTLREEIYRRTMGLGNKIGGYPVFAKPDPRQYKAEDKRFVLLQLEKDLICVTMNPNQSVACDFSDLLFDYNK